jgi:hypothetical protein
MSTDKCLFVERVKCFARWHEDQFDVLDEPREPVANHAGWKRGGEYWIRPDIWRDTIFEGNEIASVDAARTLRDLGLLRVQDTRNFQAVVGVRNHKTARAYVVKPEIREWKPTEPVYGIYGAPQIGLSSSQGNVFADRPLAHHQVSSSFSSNTLTSQVRYAPPPANDGCFGAVMMPRSMADE